MQHLTNKVKTQMFDLPTGPSQGISDTLSAADATHTKIKFVFTEN